MGASDSDKGGTTVLPEAVVADGRRVWESLTRRIQEAFARRSRTLTGGAPLPRGAARGRACAAPAAAPRATKPVAAKAKPARAAPAAGGRAGRPSASASAAFVVSY